MRTLALGVLGLMACAAAGAQEPDNRPTYIMFGWETMTMSGYTWVAGPVAADRCFALFDRLKAKGPQVFDGMPVPPDMQLTAHGCYDRNAFLSRIMSRNCHPTRHDEMPLDRHGKVLTWIYRCIGF